MPLPCKTLTPLIVACALFISACGRSPGAGELEFKTTKVTRGDIEHRVIATGKIKPLSKVEIRSKVDGIIKTIAVDEGDHVSKGQIILELDKDILSSRVKEAQSSLERAQARYEQARIEASTSEMDSVQKRYDRLKRLFEQGLVPEQQLEDAETALTIATETHKARRTAISMAKAELSAVTAALERAENELSYATIVSPVDGIVLSRDVDVGGAVASVVSTMGTLLMTLGDVREMHLVGDVDESDVGLVREGMPARITVESYPGKKFQGTVKTISPLGVEKDKIMNFEVEVTIEANDVPLRSNMTADAEIIIEEHKNVLLLPQNAIRYKREQSFVEVPDSKADTHKRAVDVALGITGTNFSEVLSGLKEGDEVIVSGQ
ncbi:efflux RND transporter periplasmic adaptor subunit [Candidatus Poribacteria bacterium]|nr:efflux RND transporter periplasmic adaptor subunit [Candidatus Poribacteria bacterium]